MGVGNLIIDALIDFGMTLLEMLTSVFEVPEMPDNVQTIMDTFTGYLTTGIAILQNFVHMDYLLILFGIVVAFNAGILIYKGIMWVLRKIPMLGIS